MRIWYLHKIFDTSCSKLIVFVISSKNCHPVKTNRNKWKVHRLLLLFLYVTFASTQSLSLNRHHLRHSSISLLNSLSAAYIANFPPPLSNIQKSAAYLFASLSKTLNFPRFSSASEYLVFQENGIDAFVYMCHEWIWISGILQFNIQISKTFYLKILFLTKKCLITAS